MSPPVRTLMTLPVMMSASSLKMRRSDSMSFSAAAFGVAFVVSAFAESVLVESTFVVSLPGLAWLLSPDDEGSRLYQRMTASTTSTAMTIFFVESC